MKKGSDRSGDNLVLYDDGHGYCFACGNYEHSLSPLTHEQDDDTIVLLGEEKDITLTDNLDYYAFRGASIATAKTYDVKSTVRDGVATDRQYKYGDFKTKVRVLGPSKQFHITGSKDKSAYPLFGMNLFSAGEAKAITITEGEEDALAAFQMLGSKYPCVSVESASQALGNCRAAYDYLNTFEKIYLCFDNDEPGKKAALEVSALFDPNKVFVVSLTKHKDASDFLQKGEEKQFISCWWSAKKYTPKGMLASYSDIDEVVRKEDKGTVAHYPFSTLDEKTYGIRYGEYILFMAQEKIGKTEVFRAIEHHLLKTTNERIGLIHLEDTDKRTVQGIVTYESGIPCHLPDRKLSPDEMLEYYKSATNGDESRVQIYSHFGSDDPNTILDILRYLVKTCGCKFIFLDHITMLVTGFEDEDERKKLDYLSTKLAMLVKELDFTLFLITHVNDEGKARGSRNITKVCDISVRMERDKENDDVNIRNTTRLSVVDNRFCGHTGFAGNLFFNPDTYTLSEKEAGYAEEAKSMGF